MTGALGALYFTGGTLNVYSQIGLVTLVGLITKHGILIVEFANQQQEKGLDRLEAVIEAASLRLRPILMTTGAMVLGAVPLALATGAGAKVATRSAGSSSAACRSARCLRCLSCRWSTSRLSAPAVRARGASRPGGVVLTFRRNPPDRAKTILRLRRRREHDARRGLGIDAHECAHA
jgi:hypothetical protein